MSELKAYRDLQGALHYEVARGTDYDGKVYVFKDEDEVYLKSEADKVIAELKKEKEYVIKNMAEVINSQEREIRKQKREKYLVMADKCYANAMLMYLKRDTDPVKECSMWYHRRGLWWEKWKRNWLKIADELKE